VIILTVILGLFLQFDLSVRLTESPKSDYLPNLKLGHGRGKEEWTRPQRESWLGDEDEADPVVQKGKVVTSMSDSKLRWGQEGPARTQVMAHAPGTSRASGNWSVELTRRVDGIRFDVSVQRDLVLGHG
jgi:hypothetical protein